MIGKLKGTVENILSDALLIDVHDVGYIVYVPSYISHKANVGAELTLYIEHLIRPEAFTLYGFLTLEEKLLFQKLMSVQGVGGKAANAILSVLSPEQLLSAILAEDSAAIKRADGIGPKVAGRVIAELKNFAQKQSLSGDSPASLPHSSGKAYADALSTLTQLGYKPAEAQKALDLVSNDKSDLATAEEIVPEALKRLGKNFL